MRKIVTLTAIVILLIGLQAVEIIEANPVS
jgi:hypothetical protein